MSDIADKARRVRRYDRRKERGGWLGRVVIADDGYFSAVTDWGNYGYWWTSFGDDFRDFLLGVGSDYLLSKVAPRQKYDGSRTVAHVRREIGRMARSGTITRKVARHEFHRIKHHYHDPREDLAMWRDSCSVPIDPGDMVRTSPDPDAVMFCTVVLNALKTAIRAEMEAEASVRGAA